MLTIPKVGSKIIPVTEIPKDMSFGGLRLLRAQSDASVMSRWANKEYECQQPAGDWNELQAIVSMKGYVDTEGKPRVVAFLNLSLKEFTRVVMYDPSNPPVDDYQALGMKEAHDQTQSDFKGQKAQNKNDFRDYLLEGLAGQRPLFLPAVSGWQSEAVFDRTVFIAFDESRPNSLYGYLYMPKSPVMQADGQTQTAALFAVANSKEAMEKGALDKLQVSLEVEMNVSKRSAGQSFADRNGRGSKKNKNLVISLDTSSALSDLRVKAVAGSIFEDRVSTGRSTSTTETATGCIVDLSTMEQMLLNVIADGKRKPEHVKHVHIKHFEKYANEFVELLGECFGANWPQATPSTSEPFRKLYVHGWPFALKAIALAYHHSRYDELGPLGAAIATSHDAGKTVEEAFDAAVENEKKKGTYVATITFDELKSRLKAIDWYRHRKHWTDITGVKLAKNGKKRTRDLKGVGKVVVAQAQNTASIINAVASKIQSDTWVDLTGSVDTPT